VYVLILDQSVIGVKKGIN